MKEEKMGQEEPAGKQTAMPRLAWFVITALLGTTVFSTTYAYRSYRDMKQITHDQEELVAVSESCIEQIKSSTKRYVALADEAKRLTESTQKCADSLEQCIQEMREDTKGKEEMMSSLRGETALMNELATCREGRAYDNKQALLALHQAKENLDYCHEEIGKLQKRLLTPCGMPAPTTP